jgi:hypothetical protein
MDRFKEDLDRYLTGNYGEDSLPTEERFSYEERLETMVIKKDKITIHEVREALDQILINQDVPQLKWCVNYAQHALTITDPYDMYVQLLYVLDNMKRWRGTVAKQVRTVLKQFVKENEPKG